MALSKEQFLELRKTGMTVDDIINQETAGQKSVGGFIGNVVNSGINAITGVASAIAHPIQTAKTLGSIALGGVEKLIPGQQADEQSFDSLINVFKDRYGSVDQLVNTMYKDPVGFALDLSTVTGLGGAALKGTRMAELGTGLTKVSEAVNPISAVTSRLATKVPETLFAPTVSEINNAALKAAESQGIKLPASAIRDNVYINQIETLAAKGIGGQKIVDTINKANADMVRIADELVAKTSPVNDLSVIGKDMALGATKFKTAWESTKKLLYEDFNSKAGKLPAITTETKSALRKVLNDRSSVIGVKNITPIKKMINELSPANTKNAVPISYEVLKETLDRAVNPNTKLANAKEAGDFKFIAEAIDKDLKATIQQYNPEAAKLLDTANTTFKDGLLKLNSSYGKKISELAKAQQFDKILPGIISPTTSVDDIPRILELVGKENLPKMQSYVMKDIFDNAINKDGIFTQNGITKGLERYGAKAEAILSPEQIKTVKELEVLSKAMQASQKVSQGSQTAYLARTIGEPLTAITGLADLLTGNILAFVAKLTPLVGDFAMSKFLASEIGQNILINGWKFGATPAELLRITGSRVGLGTGVVQQTEKVRQENSTRE